MRLMCSVFPVFESGNHRRNTTRAQTRFPHHPWWLLCIVPHTAMIPRLVQQIFCANTDFLDLSECNVREFIWSFKTQLQFIAFRGVLVQIPSRCPTDASGSQARCEPSIHHNYNKSTTALLPVTVLRDPTAQTILYPLPLLCSDGVYGNTNCTGLHYCMTCVCFMW